MARDLSYWIFSSHCHGKEQRLAWLETMFATVEIKRKVDGRLVNQWKRFFLFDSISDNSNLSSQIWHHWLQKSLAWPVALVSLYPKDQGGLVPVSWQCDLPSVEKGIQLGSCLLSFNHLPVTDGKQRGKEKSLEEQEISVFYMIPVGPDTRDVWQWEQSCSHSVSV